MSMRAWSCALLGSLVMAGAIGWAYCRPRAHIDISLKGDIVQGMTRGEAEAALGGPAGDYTSGPLIYDGLIPAGLGRDAADVSVWETDQGAYYIWCDERGTILETYFWSAHRRDETILERLRRLLNIGSGSCDGVAW